MSHYDRFKVRLESYRPKLEQLKRRSQNTDELFKNALSEYVEKDRALRDTAVDLDAITNPALATLELMVRRSQLARLQKENPVLPLPSDPPEKYIPQRDISEMKTVIMTSVQLTQRKDES